jgi:adenylate cyclase
MAALSLALYWGALLAHFEGNAVEVERLASELIELSTRQNFALWVGAGAFLRGWARSALGNPEEGPSWIEQGIRDLRATAAILTLPYYLGCKAEALRLAGRTPEALEAIEEAEALAARSGERWWYAEPLRLRAVFLTAIGGDETKIEASFLHSHQDR